MTCVTGAVKKIVFENDTGFRIMQVESEEFGEFVVAGAVEAAVGQHVTAEGSWKNHPTHGRQFAASSLTASNPVSEAGMVAYLSSGIFPGIGPANAKRIVQRFGLIALDVIDADVNALREIPGIGVAKLEKIKAGWEDQRLVRHVYLFLQSQGISSSQARRIYKAYGEEAVEKIKENPYQLARDVRGIGFKQADAIAMRLGIPKTSLQRLRAGLIYLMGEANSNGNCGLEEVELIARAVETLEVSAESARQALAIELGDETGKLTAHGDEIHQRYLAKAEEIIARELSSLAGSPPSWNITDIDAHIDAFELSSGMTLAAQQREAIRMASHSKVMVLTGGPGCGKTTIVNAILTVLSGYAGTIELAAPTGKAAKRLSESTGLEAKTLHRLLGIQGEGPTVEVTCDLLVVDESSMIDVSMMSALLRSLSKKTALLLVGDVDQLPSVGPGRVLADIIDSKTVPVTVLDQVFRQAQGSQIVSNAHRINKGINPEVRSDGDFYIIPTDDPDKAKDVIRRLVMDRIPSRFGIASSDIQVLSPMNRTPTGATEMNSFLQALINPNPSARIKSGAYTFGVGDRVMQIVNNYDKTIFNGDTGEVVAVDEENRAIKVAFDSGILDYPAEELDQLVLAYAMTIHKSQGSQFPAVIIPVTTQHFVMLQRNLLYTGITRASKLLILVGQMKAIQMAVKNTDSKKRITRLMRLLNPSQSLRKETV